MADFLTTVAPKMFQMFKWLGILFIVLIILVVGIIFIMNLKRRKWKVEIHEQKADGKLHTIGYDILIERKLKMGTKTIYWLKKAKKEVIPPPDNVVDRYKGKDEVDYIRVERDYVPLERTVKTNYNDPKVRKVVTSYYDRIRNKIRGVKTSLFDSEPVRDRSMYIPVEKSLTANFTFRPIDYDMNIMAINQISNADEFYQSKYEFWKKYGAVIVFGLTIVFLIIVIVLTYEYALDTLTTVMGKIDTTNGILGDLVGRVSGNTPPP